MSKRIDGICPTLFIMSLLLAVSLPALAADESGYALLLQSSPAEGGSIMPGDGVHRVQVGDQINLAAVPCLGYRFLYWIGDVGQSGSAETSIRVDSPKMVVAVFERDRFEKLPEVGAVGGTVNQSTNNSGLTRSPSHSSPSGTSATGSVNTIIVSGGEGSTEEKKVETPEVPEPATMLLLGMGAMAMARMRNKK